MKPKRNKGAGKRRYQFTKEDCKRGYQAALEKCSEDWNLLAWLFRRLRRHFRKKGE